MNVLHTIAIIGLLISPTAKAAEAMGEPSELDNYNVIWDSPSANSMGSMPIGNGDIGMNVWMEPTGDMVLLLAKTDAWSENCRLLKLGRIRITSDIPLCKDGGTFAQTLDLKTGTITIQAEATIRIWVDAYKPVIHVQVESDTPRKITVKHETWRTKRRQLKDMELFSAYGSEDRSLKGRFVTAKPLMVEPDTILDGQSGRIVFFHRNERSMWEENLRMQSLDKTADTAKDPLTHRTFGAIVQGSGLISQDKQTLTSKTAATSFAIAIFPHTAQTDSVQDWVKQVEKNVATHDAQAIEKAYASHAKWWGDFWNRSWLYATGDDDAIAVTRGYVLQRYINACAGRGHFPIKFNGSLFTVDSSMPVKNLRYDADYRDWGGCYWWQNTRLPYWTMLASGDFDMMKPLFKMYVDALTSRQEASRTYYRHDGAFYPETIQFWGAYASSNYGWHREGLPLGEPINDSTKIYYQGGLELSNMMFQYCDYTGNTEFLNNTVIPFAHQIVTFYDQHYKLNDQGKREFYPCYALEDLWIVRNPMPELAGLKTDLGFLLKYTSDAKQHADYARMLKQLPDLPTAKDKTGTPRFAACEPLKWKFRKGNTEKAELYASFPYLLHGVGRPNLDMVKEAWRHSTKTYNGQPMYGWNQDPIFLACLGETTHAKNLLAKRSRMKFEYSRFPAFWTPGHDWVPDQDHGGVNMIGFQKMMLQCDSPTQSDQLFLLPAWPKEWNGSFKLCAPKQTTVEGGFKNGKLINLKVTPESRRKDVVIGTQ